MKLSLTLLGTLCCVSAVAAKPPELIQKGDVAPTFESLDDRGNLWKSGDYVGKKVIVVYFYPADMSGVCTEQARAYQARLSDLKAAGVTVVGVSGDSVGNHQLFKKANSLKFPLLADEDGKVARAFGVPTRVGGRMSRIVGGKEKMLVRGVTAPRWTFVIGLDGCILQKNTDVNPTTDSRSVLKVVRQLTASAQ